MATGLCQQPDAGSRANCILAPEPQDSKPRGIACKKYLTFSLQKIYVFNPVGEVGLRLSVPQTQCGSLMPWFQTIEVWGKSVMLANLRDKKLNFGLE